MKRNLAILILAGLLLMPTVLLGATQIEEPPDPPPIKTLLDLVTIMNKVGEYIFAIVFALSIIFILVSAFQFLTAAGNPERITSARQVLIYALVAVGIAVVAWGLPKIILALLSTTT